MNFFKKLFGDGGSAESPEFKTLLQSSLAGLQLQRESHHRAWRFGEQDRWDLSQDDGLLVFSFPDVVASMPAQIVGSRDGNSGTWMWAWANPSISRQLAGHAARVRQYGQQHNIERLITNNWQATTLDGWHMTALACRLCQANGGFLGAIGATEIFFTFGKARLNKQA